MRIVHVKALPIIKQKAVANHETHYLTPRPYGPHIRIDTPIATNHLPFHLPIRSGRVYVLLNRLSSTNTLDELLV